MRVIVKPSDDIYVDSKERSVEITFDGCQDNIQVPPHRMPLAHSPIPESCKSCFLKTALSQPYHPGSPVNITLSNNDDLARNAQWARQPGTTHVRRIIFHLIFVRKTNAENCQCTILKKVCRSFLELFQRQNERFGLRL